MKNDKVERFWHTVYYRFLSIICVDYDHVQAVAYLGGHGAMPPFGPTMKIFYRRLYMKKCAFCRFPANFRKNGQICGFH